MTNSTCLQPSSSSLRVSPRPTPAIHAASPRSRAATSAPLSPNRSAHLPPTLRAARWLWPDCLRLLDPQRARRSIPLSPSVSFRIVALFATALSVLTCAHAASLRGSLSCSEAGDLESFGQTLPAVRTQESEASFGTDLWQTEADQISFTVSARSTELRRTRTHWTGSVAPQTGVDAQGFWSAPLPDELQDVGLDLTWQHRFSPEWTLMIQARPSCRTAGTTALVSDGFGVTGSALAVWHVSERLQFAFGAAGDSLASGSQQLLPVAGLDWGFTEHWRLSLGLPRTGVFWQVSEALELGLAAEGGWNTYYVRQRGAATYPYGRPLTETKLEHVEGRAGFQANWNLTQAIQLNLSIGVVGVRRFEYTDRNLVLKSSGTPGGYGSLGVTVNF
ncbi:MAG: hypothetical protein HYV95_15580 [Opitutae bacterium]|nr:hypothetical protein [Opitutae bacterium]